MSGKRVCWLSGVLCVVGLAAGPGSAEEVSFAPVVHYPAGECPIGLAACDLDGDGDLDLAVAGFVASVLFNDGTGAFGDLVSFPDLFASSVACGDVDGDGDNDIVVGAGYIYGNTLLINDGSGILTAVEGPSTDPENSVVNPTGVSLCDFDSDGDLDLGFATGIDYQDKRKIEIFRNRGDGTFTHGRGFEVVRYSKDLHGIACADLEGDGNSDFIGYADAFRDFIVIGSLPHGRFQWRNMHVRAHPVDVAFGELDGEPGIDAVAVHRGQSGPPDRREGVFVLKNDGAGNLSRWLDLEGFGEAHAVTVGHIDSDGLLDIVVTDTVGGFAKVFLQEPQGFTHVGSFPVEHNVNKILAADLNADGYDDLIIPADTGEVVSVLLNTTGNP